MRVRGAITKLGLDVELRDIRMDPRHRADLVAARGRTTVPVLRIETAAGDEWMPESRDIVRYLQTLAGEPPKPATLTRMIDRVSRRLRGDAS